MLWLYAALVSGILFSAVAVLSKEIMDETSSVLFTSIYALLSSIFYLPIFLYYLSTTGISLNTGIVPLIMLSGLANVFAILGFNYSVKQTDISIAMPLNRLQPVFVALIGALVLGEVINLSLALGIVLVTIGSYFVLLKNRNHPLEPFLNLKHDRGAQMATASAAFFGVAAVTDRFVTQILRPEIYTFLLLMVMALTINTYLYSKNPKHFTKIKTELTLRPKIYLLTGLLVSGAYFSVLSALSMAQASKVIPVLQIQIPLTVIAGKTFFSEEHMVQKLIGSLILIAGIALTAI